VAAIRTDHIGCFNHYFPFNETSEYDTPVLVPMFVNKVVIVYGIASVLPEDFQFFHGIIPAKVCSRVLIGNLKFVKRDLYAFVILNLNTYGNKLLGTGHLLTIYILPHAVIIRTMGQEKK
jgi:hypothetical protein